MENEVVIHVRAEDDTGKTFDAIKAKAKKLGEDLERDLKQAGIKAGRSLADGIRDGLKAHHQLIVQEAKSIGEDVEDVMARHGNNAGAELGQGIQDGVGLHAGDITGQITAIGESAETEMGRSGRNAGEKFGEGLKDGIKGGGGGDDESLAGKLIPNAAGAGVSAGRKVATSLMGTIASELGNAKHPAIAGAILAGLATVAPLIGGVLGAAVIGTGGALGIAGGFAASVSDPRVRGASKALKDIIEDDLKVAGKSFAPTTIAAIGQVRDAWKTVLPDIQSIFDKSAPLMAPFIDGILDGVASLVDGIDDALGDAGPVMEAFGALARDVGGDLGEMFAELGDDGPALASSLEVLADAFGVVADAMTEVISFSAQWVAQGPAVVDDIRRRYDAVLDFLGITDGLRDGTEAVSIENAVWHDSSMDVVDGIEAQIAAMQTLQEEMEQQTDPLFEVLDAQDRVRLAQEKYNKAVKDFGEESPKAKDALRKMGVASLDMTDALIKAAGEGFNGRLTPAMHAAMKQAGMSKKEIDALEKELIAAWRASEKWSGTYVAKYRVQYSSSGSKTGNFGEGGDFSGVGGLASGGIKGAANGSTSSGLTMVGEYGPELLNLPAGTRVSSNADTRRQMSQDTAYQGTAAATQAFIKFDPSSAHELIRAIMKSLRMEIREQGGSVQTVLGTSSVG